MMTALPDWQRLEWQGCPIYVDPEKPDWAVPAPHADILLQALQRTGTVQEAACRLDTAAAPAGTLLALDRLESQLNKGAPPPYRGRAEHLELSSLKECWFHLTNRCNLACRHCLFSASPAAAEILPPTLLRQAIDEARRLGCTLFYFTGGEPFLYPGFSALLAELLAEPAVHVVVLTNGLLLDEHRAALTQLPQERLHLQISLDGLRATHDGLRGSGTFDRLLAILKTMRADGCLVTLSVAVNRANVAELPALVALAADHGVRNLHLLWHFVRGKGSSAQFVPPADILPHLLLAQQEAEKFGVVIDNIEAIRGQLFSSPGTRYDCSNTGWESLAVGPDGVIYPSPALVGLDELNCGAVSDGLETAWRQSPVLDAIRQTSLIDSPACAANPLKFLIGGGDLDHSYLAGGAFCGHDPYVALYNAIALWLIARQAGRYPHWAENELLLRMGDVRHDCPDGGGSVSLTHCNCVISLAGDLGHRSVREFYARAAKTANREIANPFAPSQAQADFIPMVSRQRSYGCGSPVTDAALKPGEVLVDLGSGSGVECFMAAALVGRQGMVYGIDMTDEMLALARDSQQEVRARLGYDNVEFKKGFLEELPLVACCADAVISNCVVNLSPDKRRTFHEIFRVLKPGGRLVISDIVTDTVIPVSIRNNERFRGECLGGAMHQEDLMAMLRAAGFTAARLIKRFPYRLAEDVQFYSLTYCAFKPGQAETMEVIYRGPFAALTTDSGILLVKGKRTAIPVADACQLDDSILLLDQHGAVTNLAMTDSCCPTGPAAVEPLPSLAPLPSTGCCGAPAAEQPDDAAKIIAFPAPATGHPSRHASGCMVCGGEIAYLPQHREAACHYCGGFSKTNSVCAAGHYICDDCHQRDGLAVIQLLCTQTAETDMLALLDAIRRHPAIPLHGPEHHAMVPGIMLTTYRNRGGKIDKSAILTAIERGSKVPGGVCGFWGNCGAAAGVGIGFSVLLDATPLTPDSRQQVQRITAQVLNHIAAVKGARCCQRETVTALREAARLSEKILPVPLVAAFPLHCRQHAGNRECIHQHCPLWTAATTNIRRGA